MEDGFRADAAIAANVTTAVRRSALKLLPDLSASQKSTLAEAPIEGNSLFGGRLQDTNLAESSEKRRGESRMIKALSLRSRSSNQSTFAFPSGRSTASRAPSTYSRGTSRSQTTSARGGQRPRGQRTSAFPSPSRGRGRGRRSTSSTSRGRSQRRV